MKYLITITCLFLGTLIASAESASQRTKHYNLKKGLAIQGYDPVSYFSNSPKEGKKELSHTHKGVTYHFVSQANLNKFKSTPTKYEPQYGGWCAYALAKGGGKVKINPKSYKIISGKLYLFYNAFPGGDTLKKWNKESDTSQIQTANKAWQKHTS